VIVNVKKRGLYGMVSFVSSLKIVKKIIRRTGSEALFDSFSELRQKGQLGDRSVIGQIIIVEIVFLRQRIF